MMVKRVFMPGEIGSKLMYFMHDLSQEIAWYEFETTKVVANQMKIASLICFQKLNDFCNK